ncbi:MAG: hypothetical protein KDK91_32040 [Gammaproteobacteria bacterium]|nr:hypothetical protein [Gammaproteobacteria bacterium]
MVEFTIVLVFAVMVLVMGPGGDVIAELFMVSKETHRGYEFSMSMSPLPDFDSAENHADALREQGYPEAVVERLAVSEQDLYDELEPYNDRFDEINKVNRVFDLIEDPPSFNDLRREAINTLRSSIF